MFAFILASICSSSLCIIIRTCPWVAIARMDFSTTGSGGPNPLTSVNNFSYPWLLIIFSLASVQSQSRRLRQGFCEKKIISCSQIFSLTTKNDRKKPRMVDLAKSWDIVNNYKVIQKIHLVNFYHSRIEVLQIAHLLAKAATFESLSLVRQNLRE